MTDTSNGKPVDYEESFEGGSPEKGSKTVGNSLPGGAEASGPMFFNISGNDSALASSGESGSAPSLLEAAAPLVEDDIPSLDDIPPTLPVAEQVRQVDPEFDSLPGLETSGSKLGFWAIVLGALGVLLAFVSFGGGLNLRIALGLGLIGLTLSVASFFQKPRVVKSVIGSLLCFALAAGAGAGLFIQMRRKTGERLAQETLNASFNPNVSSSASSSELPADVLAKEGNEGSNNADGDNSTSEVVDPLVLVPPELRPSPEEKVPSLPGYDEYGETILPPERRTSGVWKENRVIAAIWTEAEKGFLQGSTEQQRSFAARVAGFVGYPYEVYAEFSPELRLYVLHEAVLASGVDLSNFKEIPARSAAVSLYSPEGVGGTGASGGSSDQGPGPLPLDRVVNSSFSLDQVEKLLSYRKFGTLSDGVGKFMEGASPIQVRALLDEAMAISVARDEPSGAKVYEARFGRQVGWDASGLASTRIRLVFDPSGVLEDAYPY